MAQQTEEDHDLDPCPYCGSEPEMCWFREREFVLCPECGLRGPCVHSKSDAVAFWNGLTFDQ